MQSAYREFHSTETALLRVHNDISVSLDKGHVTALTLVDVSAAFDIIDHNTLTNRAEWYGVSGMALTWFKSYLCGRHQKLKLTNLFLTLVCLSMECGRALYLALCFSVCTPLL